MPTYEYECSVCKHREDQVRTIAARDEVRHCPRCLAHAKVENQPGVMVRDVAASMRVHTDTGYQQPIYSDSMGIEPSAVAQARRDNPHHEYTDDGRMVFRSHQQRERILRESGFVDKGRKGWY